VYLFSEGSSEKKCVVHEGKKKSKRRELSPEVPLFFLHILLLR
jgi:hypothetical protein